jgi:riboflavin synthase
MQVEFPPGAVDSVSIGASVALNGTCLTVTQIDGSVLNFDVIAETLRRTNLEGLAIGSKLNFERSARVGDEIGGHNVSGHVHTTASIAAVQRNKENVQLRFRLKDSSWMKYILPKGFVSVDGCSLTVGEVRTSP